MKIFNVESRKPLEILEQNIPGVKSEKVLSDEETLKLIALGVLKPGQLTSDQIIEKQNRVRPFGNSLKQYNKFDQS